MMDIDHFKKVNDVYGHTVGDDVIRQVSKAISSQVRDIDIAGRYGGEEFGIILTHTNVQGAVIFAERLRSTIEKLVVHTGEQEVRFTISIGVAELTSKITDHRAWIETADGALYKSKENGRNRVTCA
jgi:diguanylate cyclase (GGDEF)-like protein